MCNYCAQLREECLVLCEQVCESIYVVMNLRWLQLLVARSPQQWFMSVVRACGKGQSSLMPPTRKTCAQLRVEGLALCEQVWPCVCV